MKTISVIVVSLLFGSIGMADNKETVSFSSDNEQTIMVELFTSQGCSSCPPAENWLNRFVSNNKLWDEVVPIAFHVDYWDKVGWPDIYANHDYSLRQYTHRQQGHIKSVYTPGVMVNGQEWRGWIRGKNLPSGSNDAGILSFSANKNTVNVNYSRTDNNTVLNIALLGVGIETNIERGENRNKVLKQEFVALSHKIYAPNQGVWNIDLPKEASQHAERYALAIWVSSIDDISPIQATGYWIPNEWVES